MPIDKNKILAIIEKIRKILFFEIIKTSSVLPPPPPKAPPKPKESVVIEPLSEGSRRPEWQLLTVTLPIGILFLLFLHGYGFISKEMDIGNLHAFRIQEGILLFDILLFSVLTVIMKIKKKLWNIPAYLVMLIFQLILLTISLNILDDIRPDGVNDFIFHTGHYFCYLFTFFMPSIIHPAFAISVSMNYRNIAKNLAISAFTVIALPTGLYLLAQMFMALIRYFYRNDIHFFRGHDIPQISIIFFFAFLIVISAAFIIAVIRMLVSTYISLEKSYGAKWIIPLIAALIFPLGGLVLNALIPFPVDFQDWRVYALTIFNAFFLLLPSFKNRYLEFFSFFWRCACYSFTLYFFLVFLPYLPLFLPAVIVMGTGFLILSPLILFYVHTRRLAEDFKGLKQDFSRPLIVLTLLAGISVLPAYVTFKALHDRALLEDGLRLIYSSDYDDKFMEKSETAEKTKELLESIYSFKQGLDVPYLTSYYQWVAFDNMTLSTSKLNDAYFKLTGKKLKPETISFRRDSFWSTMPRNNVEKRFRGRDIVLQDVEKKYEHLNDATTKCRLTLKVKNDAHSNNQEAIFDIYMPEWVFISGNSLKINKDFVPGRIFEKKSAIWIYEKIVNVRKDPSLLYYVTTGHLRLHIFPFGANETRYSEIELLYPSSLSPEIKIAEHTIKLESRTTPVSPADFSIISPEDNSALPKLARKPVLCFIIDASKPSVTRLKSSWNDIIKRISESTGIKDVSLIFATTVPETLMKKTNLDDAAFKMPDLKVLPGGFMAERILKTEILRWKSYDGNFPVFAVISGNPELKIADCRFDGFGDSLPETGYFLFFNPAENEIKRFDLDNGKFERMDTVSFHPVSSSAMGITRRDAVNVYPGGNPEKNSLYAKALLLKKEYNEYCQRPSLSDKLFPEIVEQSKKTGIMSPLTSYIVLERDSQWKKLESVEKKVLNSNKEFDIEEKVPEPGFIILAAILVIIFLISKISGLDTFMKSRVFFMRK